MLAKSPKSALTSSPISMDLALVAFLVVFDVAARLLPHAPGVWPVAASALFAGRVLHRPLLAFIVPLAATVLSNVALPGDQWQVLAIVSASLCVPVLLGILARRWSGALPVVAGMVASSLFFFATTNFAVWAFNNMYPMTVDGLIQCYVAALPFLDRTVLGDLAWCAVLFGGAWLVQHGPSLARRAQ